VREGSPFSVDFADSVESVEIQRTVNEPDLKNL